MSKRAIEHRRLRRVGSAVLAALWAVFVLVLASPVLAAPPAASASAPNAGFAAASRPGGPAWGKLTASQQSVLSPLKGEWAGIDAARKRKWLDIADRFGQLPADEQGRIRERMVEWARLSPEERARARFNFQEAKQLSPQDRQARWEEYLALPEADRMALAARARSPAPGAASAPSAGASASKVRPVAPTVVQAQPGATTTSMAPKPARPLAVPPGAPKVAMQPAMVNPTTLLPQTGPQAAASNRAASATP